MDPKFPPDFITQQGWASAISAVPRTPVWKGSPGVEEDLNSPHHGALTLAFIETQWPRVGQAIREDLTTWPRYAFEVLDGQRGPTYNGPKSTNITPLTEATHNSPHCFSDGSLIRPTNPPTAIGTFAVWHPERTIPPNPVENIVAENDNQNQQRISRYARLGGQAISPTQTEAAGCFLSALATFPTHTAVDTLFRPNLQRHSHQNHQRPPLALATPQERRYIVRVRKTCQHKRPSHHNKLHNQSSPH